MTDLIGRILAIAGILERDAEFELDELKQKHPELQDAYDAFLHWVQPQLIAVTDPRTAAGLVSKIAEELKSGHPSYDPGAWSIG